jgi:arabinofuranosyltransferase
VSAGGEKADRLAWIPFFVAVTYGAAFVAVSSFHVGGARQLVLLDDAMISMKYARTLLGGGGFRWYPGAERVLGVTNPLWTLLMAPLQAMPLAPERVSVLVQAVGVLAVAGASMLVYTLASAWLADRRLALIPAVWTALYFPLHFWSDLGMEAGALTVLALAIFRSADRGLDGQGVSLRWLAACAATGVAVRLDFAIFPGAAALALVAGRRWRPALCLAAVTGAAVAAILAAQWAYFGDPMPNTAYLKLGVPAAVRIGRGWRSASAFVANFSPAILLAAVALTWRWWRARRARALLFAAFAAAALGYDIFVGGDAWEADVATNRFLLPIAPLLFLVVALGVERAAAFFPRRQWMAALIAIPLLARMSVGAGERVDPANGPASWGERFAEWTLRAPPHYRLAHDLKTLTAGLFLRDALRRPVRVAVSSAGIAPFLLDGTFVDILGKSDRRIAHEPPQQMDFLPGHMKWDLDYSIGELAPDVLIGNWAGAASRMREAVVLDGGRDGGFPIFIRRGALAEAFRPSVELAPLLAKYGYAVAP